MKLYNYWRSSSSWRVRAALALKGVPYEYVAVNLLAGEQRAAAHLQRNPSGAVPVWELNNGTHLSQSLAIVEYLEETFPTPSLFPKDAVARAQVREMVEIVNSGTQPFQNPTATSYVRDICKADDKAFARHFIALGLHALEQRAAVYAGAYAYGDDVTFADCCLVPQLYAARRFEVSLASYPTLLRVEAALTTHAAFVAAHPDQQPDAANKPV